MRIPATGVTLLLACACTTARPIQPAEFVPTQGPDVVWVTAPDNSVVAVADPEVARDTLRGIRQGTHERVTIPLTAVRVVKAKVPDHAKTALFVVGMMGLGTAAVYAIWVSKAGPHPEGVDCGVYTSENDGPGGAPRPDC
jgi:hypothetical protein